MTTAPSTGPDAVPLAGRAHRRIRELPEDGALVELKQQVLEFREIIVWYINSNAPRARRRASPTMNSLPAH